MDQTCIHGQTRWIYIFQHGIHGPGLTFSCCLGVSMETTPIGMLTDAVPLGFSLRKSHRV